MIVDCHTHIRLPIDDDAVNELLQATEPAEITMVLAQSGKDRDSANNGVSEVVARMPEKLIGFASIDPTVDDISPAAISDLRDKRGFKGVVLYPAVDGWHPAHSRAMQFYENVQQTAMPLFFHSSGHLPAHAYLEYAQPFLLDEIARKFVDLKMVIGSMGRPFLEQTLSMLAKHENVYGDMTLNTQSAWQVYNTVVNAHDYNVLDKLLFGSGFPAYKTGESIEVLLGFNKLFADTKLPMVRRGDIEKIIQRDTISILGINR
jgi:hypothetical protein